MARLSVLLAAATSFLICSLLLKLSRKKGADLAEATAENVRLTVQRLSGAKPLPLKRAASLLK